MKVLFLSLFLLCFNFAKAQFLNRENLTIAEEGNIYLNPFTGGLNSCQFSELDINLDGIKDLLVFDRTGNRILPFIKSLDGNQTNYIYNPIYIDNFPDLESWVIMADFNCDGKEDIFTYNQTYAKVFLNKSTNDSLIFEVAKEALSSDYGSITKTIYISSEDIPAIVDVDSDGDLDILTFQQSGGHIEYHKNQSLEFYGTCDSLIFELETNCWGNFFEGLNTYDFENCENEQSIFPLYHQRSSSHAGSSILAIDIDGDLDKDLVLGDVSFNNLNLLINGGTILEANMNSVNQDFPVGLNTDVSGETNSFPSSFYVDVNNDGNRDLIITPNIANNAENFESIKLYLNTNSDEEPLFEFTTNDFLQNTTIDFGSGAYPCVIDYNNDGLKDLLVGNFGYFSEGDQISQLALFKNIGSQNQPIFEIIDRDFSNISQIPLNTTLNIAASGLFPTVGDLDNDGDLDLIVGDSNGKLHFFKNNENENNEAYFNLESINFFDIDIGQSAAPFLFDINDDQLLDLIIGKVNGTLSIAINHGDLQTPIFDELIDNAGNVNVSNDLGTYGFSKPFLFSENGSIKMLVASESGYIYLYDNISNNYDGTYNLVNTKFQNIKDGIKSSIVYEDFDNDGKRDMFLGNESGGLVYFINNEISNGSFSQEYNPIKVSIFPNPNNGVFTIETSEETKIMIFNLIGEKLQSSFISQSTVFDFSYLQKGTYLIKTSTVNYSKTFKIIIN
ncbi:MAG: T9SS type A sorting domain-containing protein [Flavobacteriales bacterium]